MKGEINAAVCSEEKRPEVEEEPDSGGPPVGEEGRGATCRFGWRVSWAAGSFRKWAETVPLGPFYIFISFSSFPFLFSYSIYRFCKTPSNQTKPLS
jgi:hypothetical protein